MKKKLLIPVLVVAVLLTATSYRNDYFEIAKQVEIFTTMFKELNMNYVDETNPAELMDHAIKSMLDDLDPYTRFMNEQDVESFKINNNGEYSGIGAMVRSYNDKLLIIEPYEGYPADRAGLKAGDEIVQIGDIKVSDFKDDATELLKGAKNSTVEVVYKRQGATNTTTVEREDIEVDAVPFYKMADGNTGYIVLSRFNRKAAAQTKQALEDLKEQGAENIILDLRGNPGGLLSEAIDICNLFVPKDELIVSTRSKVKKFNQEFKTRKTPVDTEIPLAILIDERSASASEIVSGALQDLDRAVVLGARSFGKGLVQRPIKLTYGTQLKVTISRYYTPSGRCIQSTDYWNRDEQGNAVSKNSFREYKTRNGRSVFDNGGVTPDVAIKELEQNALTQALNNDMLIFDFATDYYFKHPDKELQSFSFSTQDYIAFKQYVNSKDLQYKTPAEHVLETELNAEELVVMGSEVQKEYQELLSSIANSKKNALDTASDRIIKDITDELVVRYGYREGLYNYYLKEDKTIGEALSVLQDTERYQGILQ
ncbi:S41 family peptidase [Robertkochia marina]|uniref:S41 family peptidase n=1 Tax=Robertkochia marina TaxID=1227945 RepID=A0A4S3M3M8_9FLAO|nr:S41 family peptidase [Robertkochia marina]THD69299.1 S41 family peptidase [Robertkochia marina]TRZ47443.1 S41 family peptidase [Robertkochia marina]